MNRELSANVDAVRAVAVGLVVLRHVLGRVGVTHFGPFEVQLIGIFGVQLFFFLTALVLAFSLARLDDGLSPVSLAGVFLIRRAFRIYPLAIVVVTIGGLSLLGGHWPGFRDMGAADWLANLLLVQNLVAAPDIIGPLWSLPLEVQMYLFLPAIYLLARDASPRGALALYLASLVIAIASMRVPEMGVGRFMPCFLPGVLAWREARRTSRRSIPFALLGVALLGLWMLYQIGGRTSQTLAAYPACLALCLLLPRTRAMGSAFARAVCARVAALSYGIYLLHDPILEAAWTVPIPEPLRIIGFLLATWLASELAHRCVETPLIRAGAMLSRRWLAGERPGAGARVRA